MRRRLEMMQDCLAVLADGDMADARAVIGVLAHLSTWELLPKLWHQVKAPDATAAVRHDAAVIAMSVQTQRRIDEKAPTVDEDAS